MEELVNLEIVLKRLCKRPSNVFDKPYFDKIWDASYFEYINDNNPKKRTNIWASYIKNIGLPQYKTLRWRDGDLFTNYKEMALKQAQQEVGTASSDEIAKSQEINEEYEKNRSPAGTTYRLPYSLQLSYLHGEGYFPCCKHHCHREVHADPENSGKNL